MRVAQDPHALPESEMMTIDQQLDQATQDKLRTAARGKLPANAELIADIRIPMRDGILLSADVYRPKGASGPVPAVLSVAPYAKELQLAPPLLTHSIEAGATDMLVDNGYIHVIASQRGAGQSQGQYKHMATIEQTDMYDLIEWIAQQDWCDGNLAMIGDSHFAVNSIWGATQRPPHLRCIIPYDAGCDFYRDMSHPGGLFKAGFMSKWWIDAVQQFQWPGPVEGRLPPTNQIQEFLENPLDGPYWWERSPRYKLDQVEVPVLHIVPRSGIHTRGQLWGYPLLKGRKKLVVVPPPTPAKEHWLFLKSGPLKAYMVQWLDHWMKGIATPIADEPEVAIFDAGTGEWSYADSYPLAETQWTKFHLSGKGSEGSVGRIGLEAPSGTEAADTYALPDWEQVAAGKPVLSYETAPSDAPLRIWGPLAATLYASTTATDTAFFVHLDDMAPDGSVTHLTDGVLKASFRELDADQSRPGQPYHPFTKRELPDSGKVYEYQIELRPIFHTIKPGHRLRCRVQSNDPMFMNFLHTIYNTEMMPWPSFNSVHHDAEHPSHLLLPIIPDSVGPRPVSAPLADVAWPIAGLDWAS